MTTARTARQTQRSIERMAEAKTLLGGKCIKCGSTKKLEFDHIDRSTKLFTISRGSKKASDERFWAEVAKCQLLCNPHHVEKSKEEGVWKDFGAIGNRMRWGKKSAS